MKPLTGRELKEVEQVLQHPDRFPLPKILQDRPPSVVLRYRELARALLVRRIHELSQKYLHTSWYFGVEYSLWKAVCEGPQRIDTMEALELKQLSDDAEGWVYYPETASEPTFLPMAQWLREYSDYESADGIRREARVEADHAWRG